MECAYSDAVIASVIRAVEDQRATDHRTVKPTEEELALPSYTRRRLKGLPTWNLWQDAFDEQLDAHARTQTFLEPVDPPPDAIILRPHWANVIKTCGRRKCRLCADGSRRAASPRRHG